eukprot:42964_1
MVTSSAPPTVPTARSVSIAPYSNLVFVPKKTKESMARRWYSKSEYAKLRDDLMSDIGRMSRLFANTPDDVISQDRLQECIGIETFLNRGALQQLQARRNAHVKTILKAQRMCNKADLASVSEKSSQWALVAAQARASYMRTEQ